MGWYGEEGQQGVVLRGGGGGVITLCRLLFNYLAFKDFLWKIQVVSN